MNLNSCRQQLLVVSMYLASLATLSPIAVATTLADLFAGASLTSETTEFTDWELVAVDTLVLPVPDSSLIEIVPLVGDPANPGVQLLANGELSTSGLHNINLVVKFRVNASVTERLVAHELDLTDVTFGGTSGIAFISADIANGGGDAVSSGLVMADKESDFFLTPSNAPFAPEAQLEVTWDVFVAGFSSVAPVGLNSFTHRFAVATIPEPAGLTLVNVYCLLVCSWRRRGAASAAVRVK